MKENIEKEAELVNRAIKLLMILNLSFLTLQLGR